MALGGPLGRLVASGESAGALLGAFGVPWGVLGGLGGPLGSLGGGAGGPKGEPWRPIVAEGQPCKIMSFIA